VLFNGDSNVQVLCDVNDGILIIVGITLTGENEVLRGKPGKPRTRWEDVVRRYTSNILVIRG
jgi:hypothetical protein